MKAWTKETGAVLLTTLLVMGVMSGLAVSIMGRTSDALRQGRAVADIAQADSYLRGAESYALLLLEQQLSQPDALVALEASLLQPQPIVLPVENGVISVEIRDGSHCFDPTTVLDADGQEMFRRLLRTIPEERTTASVPQGPYGLDTLPAALADWQDADPTPSAGGAEDGYYLAQDPAYRAPNSPVSAISELRAVRGWTPEVHARLAPWMCLNGGARINLDTLRPEDAPLLAAGLATDTTSALALLLARPAGGWNGLEAFAAVLPEDDERPVDPDTIFTFSPDTLRVDIRVQLGEQVRRAALHLSVDGTPEVVHRARGEAAVPLVRYRPEEEEEDTDG